MLEISTIQIIGPIFFSPLARTATSNIRYGSRNVLLSYTAILLSLQYILFSLNFMLLCVPFTTGISFTLHLYQSMGLLSLKIWPNILVLQSLFLTSPCVSSQSLYTVFSFFFFFWMKSDRWIGKCSIIII